MITAQVNFYGVLRGVAGAARTIVTLPPEFGLPELMAALADQYGNAIRTRLLNKNGYLRSYVRLFVAEGESQGNPDERFGPFPSGTTRIEIYIVPMSEGG